MNHGSRPTIVVLSWHSREHRTVRVRCLVQASHADRPALCFCGGERNVKGGGRSAGLRSVVCSCLFRWNQSRWVQTSGPVRGLPSGQHMTLKQPCVDSAPPAAWFGKDELSYSVPWLKGLGPESVDANLEPCQTLFFFSPAFCFYPLLKPVFVHPEVEKQVKLGQRAVVIIDRSIKSLSCVFGAVHPRLRWMWYRHVTSGECIDKPILGGRYSAGLLSKYFLKVPAWFFFSEALSLPAEEWHMALTLTLGRCLDR